MPALIQAISHTVAFMILIAFSWKYFNETQYFLGSSVPKDITNSPDKRSYVMPVYPKYMITKYKYFSWYLIFLVFLIFLYILLYWALISVNQESIKELNLKDSVGLAPLLSLYPSLLAALILTGFIPALPKKTDFLALARNFTHSRASIPDLASSYYNSIIENGLSVAQEDISATVAFVGPEFISEADFKQRKNSLEYTWALTCYLHHKINSWTQKPNDTYTKNHNKEAIAYPNFLENFGAFKKEYKTFGSSRDQFLKEHLENHAKQIFNQIVQITVCLIFCSEPNDDQAAQKFKDLGVNVDVLMQYKARFDFLVVFLALIFVVIFISAFVIDGFLQYSQAASEPVTGNWAKNAAMIGSFLLGLPAIAVYILKSLFKLKWPLRDEFSTRSKSMPILSFFTGIILGAFSLFLVDKFFPGLFKAGPPWSYSILGGLTGIFAAYAIDCKPKEWKIANAIFCAWFWGLIASVLFGLTTCGIKLIEKDLTVQNLSSLFKDNTYSYYIIFASILGFFIGFALSFISAFATGSKNKDDLLNFNLSKYFLPLVGSAFLSNHQSLRAEMDRVVAQEGERLPSTFYLYLQEHNLISEEGFVTDNFCKKIGKLKGIDFAM